VDRCRPRVVARDRPGKALLRLAAARVEYRHGGLVDAQPRRGLQDLVHAPHHGQHLARRGPEPVGQHRAIDLDPLARHDLRPAIQRQMIRVAGDQHLSDLRLGRHTALDQPRRRERLQHHAGAGPAGELRALGHQHLVLRRDHVEPPRRIDADLDQRALAARAGRRLGQLHLLDLRQMRRQAAAPFAPALLLLRARCRRSLACLGGVLGERRFDLLIGELQLLVGQLLLLPPELPALELQQQMAQPLVLLGQRIALGGHVVVPGGQRVVLGGQRLDQSLRLEQ